MTTGHAPTPPARSSNAAHAKPANKGPPAPQHPVLARFAHLAHDAAQRQRALHPSWDHAHAAVHQNPGVAHSIAAATAKTPHPIKHPRV